MTAFENWWNNNAKKYSDDMDQLSKDGNCFDATGVSDETIDEISQFVDKVYSDPEMDVLKASMIAMQYLFEKFDINILDREIIGQLITLGHINLTKSVAESIAKSALATIYSDEDIQKLLAGELPDE